MVLYFATCSVNVLAMRKEPSHRAELLSQLLYGEHAEVLQVQNNYWAFIRSIDDEYEGWCLLGQLQLLSKREFHKAPKYLTMGLGSKLISAEAEILLPWGATIKSGSLLLGGQKAKYKGKKLAIAELKPDAQNIERYASSFRCAPYLWGGRSHEGIDCSGFSQIVMKMNGIQIARDAAQQALQGETISFLQEVRCGDLAFFGNADGRINHVGILLNEHYIIHATETAGCVVIDKIDQEGIVSKLLRKRTHSLRLIKRFF